jgi:hypothetical protein
MVDAGTYGAGGLLLVFACYRYMADQRAAPDPAMRYIRYFALSIGASLLVLSPHTMAVLDGFGPVPQLGVLAGAELKLCGLTSLALVARTLAGPDPGPARRLARQAVAGHIALAALFVPAQLHSDGGTGYVTGSGRWFLAAYDLLFVVYAVRCLVLFITLLGRHSRRIDPSALRTGLRLMTASASVGVLWTLWLLDDVVDVLRSGRQDTAEDPQSAVLALLVVVLAVSGATATVSGRMLAAPRRVVRALRAYRALEPLWSALHEAHPAIALAPSGTRVGRSGRPGLREVEFELYRRVIEIHDGRLSLRPYRPADVSAWLPAGGPAAGGPPEPDGSPDPVAEAATLAAGLAARRAGQGRLPHYTAAPPQAPSRTVTIEADVVWLLRVAAAFEALVAAGPRGSGGPDQDARTVAGAGAAWGPGGASYDVAGNVAGKEEPRPGRGDQAGAVTG